MEWTPIPFNLLNGNPFQYSESDDDISTISGSQPFETGIQARDSGKCVVCGMNDVRVLNYCHIIPKIEEDTWETMKQYGFVPANAKGVQDEPRNGVQLCRNHQLLFDAYIYYIRWMPEIRRFVLINHSQSESMEIFHGKAINLHVDNDLLPFHGAFLFHEMRVRGFWPQNEDRATPLPITWVDWINGGGSAASGDASGGRQFRSHGPVQSTSTTPQAGKTFTPTNPFSNPSELEALKKSFAEQPNWKAAVAERETWERYADENAAKWRELRVNRIA